MKLYLDPGHGGKDQGAHGNGVQEKDISLDIALRIREILNNDYQNVTVKMSRTTDTFVSLEQRTDEANAWGADYFLSIHVNSFSGRADGYEDYIYYELSDSSGTANYQDIMHEEITAVNRLDDRGPKDANFHVLRETVMPALLTENGFITDDGNASLMTDATWRQTVAQGHVNGLRRAFNLETVSSGNLYKVITGSFKDKKNAQNRVDYLQSKNVDAFAYTIDISGEQWYRVQAGAFKEKENAEKQLEKVKAAGTSDAFILTESTSAESFFKTQYKVIAGSFQGKRNAEGRLKFLKSNHIDGFIVPTNVSEKQWYRVQTGAFKDRQNAEERLSQLKKIGIKDAFIISEEEGTGDESEYSIIGDALLSPEQMDRFAQSVNPDAPSLGKYYSCFARHYGIRGDVAFSQAIHETDYFRFTGTVNPEQNNYAGIGATGPDHPGASFKSPEEGVLAHFQHLYAYVSTESLPEKHPLVDPRFDLVQRGVATTWVDLNGKWAVPGYSYGQSILRLYKEMVNDSITELNDILKSINV